MIVVSTSLFLLVLNNPAHALVIAAPFIAISAFKASVFLVSLLFLPVTTLIHVLKKWGVLKTITVALVILGLAFGIAFGTLSLFKESSSKRMVGKDSVMEYGELGARPPAYYDRIALPEQPFSFKAPNLNSPYPSAMRRGPDWSMIIIMYVVLTALLAVITLVPILIILVVVRKARNEEVGLKRILAISVLVSVTVAIPLAFGLGLLYTLTNNDVVIY